MTLEELVLKIQALLAQPWDLAPNASLQQQLDHAWQVRQLRRLAEMMNTPQQLPAFLRESWAQTRGTSLCYTAQPDSALTDVMLDVAELVNPESPILALMPDLATESLRDDYPDLDSLTREQLQNVLKTHCLSRDQRYLLPIHSLVAMELPPATNMTIPNAYHPDGAFLTAAELHQLQCHSALTEAVLDAKQRYVVASSDNRSLLSQLQQLILHLALNGAGGRGSEENAAAGAYPAIIAFSAFFQRLTPALQVQIPPALRHEIDLLLNLSSNPQANRNATANIATCINTRKSALIHAMSGHDALLSAINLEGVDNAAAITEARESFAAAKHALQTAITNSSYTGTDKLPITRALLAQVELNWSIRSERDIESLRQLSVAELSELLRDDELCASLIHHLPSLDDLVIFALATPVEKLPLFFNAILLHTNGLVRNPRELAALLVSLPVDKLTALLPLYYERLITSRMAYQEFTRHLNPAQSAAAFDVLQNRLVAWTRRVDDLMATLEQLNEAQREAFLNAIAEQLPLLIRHTTVMTMLLNTLGNFPRQRALVCEALSRHLPNLEGSLAEKITLMQQLNASQRLVLSGSIVRQWPHSITSFSQYYEVLQLCGSEEIDLVLSLPVQSWWRLSFSNVRNILSRLNAAQSRLFIRAIQVRLASVVRNSNGLLADLLQGCSEAQRGLVLEAMSEQLPNYVTDNYDVSVLLRSLDDVSARAFLQRITPKLSVLITCGADLQHLLNRLDRAKSELVFQATKQHVARLITSDDDEVFRYLNDAQREQLIDAIKVESPYAKMRWNEPVQRFLAELEATRVKGDDLKRQQHHHAGAFASRLHGTIQYEFGRLSAKAIDYPTFKANCLRAIKQARSALAAHASWDQLLRNLALAILGLGVLYLVAISINKAVTGNFLFFQEKPLMSLDKLESSVAFNQAV